MVVQGKPLLVLLFFVVCCIGNAIAALAIYFQGVSAYPLLALKDVALLVAILLGVIFFKVKVKDYIFIFSLAFFGLFFVFLSLANETPFVAAAAGFRQVILVFLFILLGNLLASDNSIGYHKSLKYILWVGVGVMVFGFFERFTHFWAPFISGYFELKNIGVLRNGYPFVMIEPLLIFKEFEDVTGFLRASSTFLDPINFGHAMVFWYLVSDLLGKRRLQVLFFLAVLLSFSKAAILQLLIISIIRLNVSLVVKLLLVLISAVVSLYFISMHAGFESHARGLMNGLGQITLLGFGLGQVGNVGAMYAQSNSGIGDSFFGALIGQVGVFGTAAWLGMFYYKLKECWEISSDFVVLILIQFSLGLLSENSFNFLSIMPVAFLCGYLSRSKFNFTHSRA